MELFVALVNQRALSGPAVMSSGPAMPGPVQLETDPSVVIRPIVLPVELVNHSALSMPTVIPWGPWIDTSLKTRTLRSVVIRSIEFDFSFLF